MENFKANSKGFRFQAQAAPAEGNRQKFGILDVFYMKGSRNKGVLASLKLVDIERCEGYSMETSVIFGDGNFSTWAKPLARKNDKEVVKVAEALDSKVVDIVAAFILDATNGKAALIAAIESLNQAVR